MEKAKRIYLDIHILQTVPPSCLNRDDTGSPKTATYGGVTRARVSSQCWKRAVRLMFRDMFNADKLGSRTKRIVPMVAQEIAKLAPDTDAEKLSKAILTAAGLKLKDEKQPEKGTDALFFMSSAQAAALAKLAVENPELLDGKGKDEAKAALLAAPAIDVALFGRMVADDPSLNNDACAQVAHSISTHAVHNEYDYFTAVDDCAPEDNAGAGHIGTVEYNSSTLYRYATVAVHELLKQLGDDTPAAVHAFVDAFVRSMPTGKQNTFANRTLPSAVYVTIREDQPVNLAGAFERPVQSDGKGYEEASQRRLVEQAQKTYREYVEKPEVALAVGDTLGEVATVMSFQELLKTIDEWMEKRLGKEDA